MECRTRAAVPRIPRGTGSADAGLKHRVIITSRLYAVLRFPRSSRFARRGTLLAVLAGDAQNPAQASSSKDEIEKLELLLGEWAAEIRHEEAPGVKEERHGSGAGKIVAKPGPGGLHILMDVELDEPGQKFNIHEIFAWDAHENAYKSYSVNNISPGVAVHTGNWEGKDLVFEAKMGGYLSRRVWSDISESGYTYTYFAGPEGQTPKKVFTILARKDTTAAARWEEILRKVQIYYSDFSARDWKKYSDHFWPGATLTTLWTPEGEAKPRVFVSTVPKFVKQAPHGPDSKPIFEEKMSGEPEIRVAGNLAQVWARCTAKFGEPGKVAEWRGVDAFTLMKHEGRWRIVALAYGHVEGDAPK